MKHTYYSISDTARKLNVETHVLRYWEEELGLDIHRNELGHRSYSDKDLLTFSHIQQLKDEGFSLQDIKIALPELKGCDKLTPPIINGLKASMKRESDSLYVIPQTGSQKNVPSKNSHKKALSENYPASGQDKLQQFREIMNSIINQAISDNNKQLAAMISDNTSERIIKEMNYLFRTLDEDEDVRIKQLEAAISAASLAKLEAAAAKKGASHGKRRLFRKKAEN